MNSLKIDHRSQFVLVLVLASFLTHFFCLIQPSLAANGSSSSEGVSSSQPLWSYQVKPNNYPNTQSSSSAPYTQPPSLFDAFNGLSQRQGALSNSPFLSILPIILIAAGGMLLLLPLLTMMTASSFGGGIGPFGGGGGYQNFGYPQVLSKRRSLDQQNLGGGQRTFIDLIEHVSSTIEDLTKRYAAPSTASTSGQASNRRAKLHNPTQATQANEPVAAPQINHKLSYEESRDSANSVNALNGQITSSTASGGNGGGSGGGSTGVN